MKCQKLATHSGYITPSFNLYAFFWGSRHCLHSYNHFVVQQLPKMARSMIFSVVLHTVLALFTSSTVVLAKNYGELIPGPGLPSLASLNLTTADIYNMISHEIHTDTEHAARPAGCFSPPNPYKDDIFACYYYLANVIPNNGCEGNGPNGISVEYCQSKTAKIRGTNLGPDGQFGSLW